MGTSSSYGGPSKNTPLVPSWLNAGNGDQPLPTQPIPIAIPQTPSDSLPLPTLQPPPAVQPSPILQPPPEASRFRAARSNFTRFASSNGSDRAKLGRAMSNYVSHSAGGARTASRRMGTSRSVGNSLIRFMVDASRRGVTQALRELNMENLARRPIEDIFVGLSDSLCQNNGTIDEGIARNAFIETIVDLTSIGITNLDGLTSEQISSIFEMFVTHTIEIRIYNDIGMKGVIFPSDLRAVENVQTQIRDFLCRAVHDALVGAQRNLTNLIFNEIPNFVDRIYEAAFELIRIYGEELAR